MRKSLFFVFCLLSCIGLSAETNLVQRTVKAERVPDDYEFLSGPDLNELLSFHRAAVVWPSQSEIVLQRADQNRKGVRSANRSTLHWMNVLLRPEYVPDVSALELVPLESSVEGCDVVRFRYRVGHTVIQGMSTSCGMIIAIKDCEKTNRISLSDDARTRNDVGGTIGSYFNHANLIMETVSASRIIKKEHSVLGAPKIVAATRNTWWGLVCWWTDGRVVLLGTAKADEGPLLPSLTEKWFSEE